MGKPTSPGHLDTEPERLRIFLGGNPVLVLRFTPQRHETKLCNMYVHTRICARLCATRNTQLVCRWAFCTSQETLNTQ